MFSWIKDPFSPLPANETRDGLQIRRYKLAPPEGPFARAFGFRRISYIFSKEIIALGPDAILCHDLEMLWASAIAAKSLGVPLLYHAHENWPVMVSENSRIEGLAFAFLERRLLQQVTHVYSVGEEQANRFRRLGMSVTVIYGSKSLEQFPKISEEDREAIRGNFGFADGDTVIGIAGSLGRDEALPSVLDALGSLPTDVKLFIVGGGEEKIRGAKALVAHRDMEARVAFTGRLPMDEYLQHTAALDVGLALFFPTTLNQVTAVPLKLFDYMGLGIPSIVSDFPEMRHIVAEACACGIAVRPDDVAAVREAIERCASDPKARRSMGARARECFSARYCWERQEDAMVRSHPIFS